MKFQIQFVPRYSRDVGMEYLVKCRVVGGEFSAEYGQIVYSHDEKVKNTTISPPIAVKISIDGMEKDVSEYKSISDLDGESSNIGQFFKDMFDSSVLWEILAKINNATPDGTKKNIDFKSTQNPKEDGTSGTWELGEDIPRIQGSENVFESRGNTYIDGEMYKVTDDDLRFVQVDGSKQYDIVDLNTHVYKEQYFIRISWKKSSGFGSGYVRSFDSTTKTIEVSEDSDGVSTDFRFDTYQQVQQKIWEISYGKDEDTDVFLSIANEQVNLKDLSLEIDNKSIFDGTASIKVARNQEVVIGRDYVDGNFVVGSLGTGNGKKVFLDYRPGKLPNKDRLVKEALPFVIDPDKTHNIEES